MARMTIPWGLSPERLTKLGHDASPSKDLERFPCTQKGIVVTLDCTEFTCRCPVTNQPDWAQIVITYVADRWIVESKSVKLYLETFRDEGIFHEHLAVVVLDDFVDTLDPLSCIVTVHFNTRGGIAITAKASYERSVEPPWITSGKLEEETE